MKIKPFLSITDKDKDSNTVTIGLTDRYRITMKESDIEDKNFSRARLVGLTVSEHSSSIEDSRTLSYLSIFTDKPVSLLDNLRNTKVLVLGCGGLGSRLVIDLSSIGVQQITTTDPDCLDASNLSRMPYFNRCDIGKFKVKLIEKYISSISSCCHVSGHPVCSLEYAKTHDICEYDFIFVTADGNFGNFFDDIGPLLGKSKIPHMPIGYWESTLIAGPLLVGESLAKLRASNNSYARNIIQRDFIPPSVGFSNSIISGVAMNEFIKHISGGNSSILKKQWQMDLFNLKSKIVDIDCFGIGF